MILLLLRPALVGAAIRDSASGGALELGLRGQEEAAGAVLTTLAGGKLGIRYQQTFFSARRVETLVFSVSEFSATSAIVCSI